MTSNTRSSFSARALSLAIVAATSNMGGVALLFAWTAPAFAATNTPDETHVCPTLSEFQHKTLEAAALGVDSLRDYLWMRRGMRGYDLVATVRWMDAYRLRAASCEGAAGTVALAIPKQSATDQQEVASRR